MFESAILDVSNYLKDDKVRLTHTMGVFETSLKLNIKYKANTLEVGLCALYHDYHKNETKEFFYKYLGEKTFMEFSQYDAVYHALAASKTLQAKYPNLSKEAYLAIKNHVFGAANMSILEKIIFVSDYCEPNRKFTDTNKIFNMAMNNLDQAVLYCINLTIEDLKLRKLNIHHKQNEALEYYQKEVSSFDEN